MTGQLFTDGDLTRDGFLTLPDPDDVPRPTTPTMTTAQVAEWLGVSERAVGVAARKREIRRVSPGRFLTSSVVCHRHASEVATIAQMLSVIGQGAAWFRINSGRVRLDADPIAGLPRFSRESINRLAVALRAGTGATA